MTFGDWKPFSVHSQQFIMVILMILSWFAINIYKCWLDITLKNLFPYGDFTEMIDELI